MAELVKNIPLCSYSTRWTLFTAHSFLSLFMLSLGGVLLQGCGGLGSGTAGASGSPSPPASSGDFSFNVQGGVLTEQLQGAPQSFSVAPEGSFTGTVQVSIQNLPAGVTVYPTGPFILSLNIQATITVFTSTSTPLGNSTLTLLGVLGSTSHTTTVMLNVLPAAPFRLDLSRTAVTMSPASQTTFTSTASVSSGSIPTPMLFEFSQLPSSSGVELTQSPYEVVTATTAAMTATLTAGVAAQNLQAFPMIVTATAGNQSSAVLLMVSVTNGFPASSGITRSNFVRTDGDVLDAVYDPVRKLVFASVESMNIVQVVSSVDGTQIAKIPIDRPRGIDESADGSEIYVGSYGRYISVINPESLLVTRRAFGPDIAVLNTAYSSYASPVLLKTLSNGKVFVVGQVGASGETHLYLWDPSTNGFTIENAVGISSFYMTRSGDHSRVVFQGSGAIPTGSLFYDVPTDTFGIAPVVTGEQAQCALSPDGSHLAAWDGQQSVIFYDKNFNQVANLPIQIQNNRAQRMIYSRDGRYLYVLTGLFPQFVANVVTVIDARSFTVLGVAPDLDLLPAYQSGTIPFDVDETGMIFGGAFKSLGLALLDVSTPGRFTSTPFSAFRLSPDQLSLTSATQTAVISNATTFAAADQFRVFFGAPPASSLTQAGSNVSVTSSQINVSAPAGKTAGSTNVTLVRSDGWYQVAPNAVSYGPQIVAVDANAGPISGGSKIFIGDSDSILTIHRSHLAARRLRSGRGWASPPQILPRFP